MFGARSPGRRESDRTGSLVTALRSTADPGREGPSGADQEAGWCCAAEAYCFSLSCLLVAALEEEREWVGVGSVWGAS
jgi:hypothetical protein